MPQSYMPDRRFFVKALKSLWFMRIKKGFAFAKPFSVSSKKIRLCRDMKKY